jgi:predicted ferric reductase
LVAAVVIHIGGLSITNPQDVMDVFLFRSPTPFSIWGVIALGAVIVAALLAVLRRRLRLRPRTWRISHGFLAMVIVGGTVVHALLIDGAMETISKAALCGLVVAATAKVIVDLAPWPRRSASR